MAFVKPVSTFAIRFVTCSHATTGICLFVPFANRHLFASLMSMPLLLSSYLPSECLHVRSVGTIGIRQALPYDVTNINMADSDDFLHSTI